MPVNPKTKKKTGEMYEREHKYKSIGMTDCSGSKAITVAQAKDLMGWTEDAEEARKWGMEEPMLTDLEGKKIYCVNNYNNRPFKQAWAEDVARIILNRMWRLNGETIVIGTHRRVISGQHRLTGLILAGQMWPTQPKWKDLWPKEPTLETLVAFGISEEDTTTQTIDNVQPRTLADVLYTHHHFRQYTTNSVREKVCRMAQNGLKHLWDRMALKNRPLAVKKLSHSEALEFIDRHERFLDSLKHIYEDNKDQSLDKFLNSGYCAALHYLMGMCKTDPDEYYGGDVSDETKMDDSHWDKACEFWSLLASGAKEFKAIRLSKRDQSVEGQSGMIFSKGEDSGSTDERAAILCTAWERFLSGQKITPASLQLEYWQEPATGSLILKELYSVGGLDEGSSGNRMGIVKAENDLETNDPEPPEPDEIQERAEKVRKQTEEERKARAAQVAKELNERRAAARKNGKAVNANEEEAVEHEEADDQEGEPQSLEQELEALRDQHGGKLLLLRRGSVYVAFGKDAVTASSLLNTTMHNSTGMARTEFPEAKLASYVQRLVNSGVQVAVCEPDGEEEPEEAADTTEEPENVTPAKKPVPKKPAPKPASKPAPKPASKPKAKVSAK